MDHQGRNLFNKKGYDFLINKLALGIPEDRILHSHPVTNIIRNNKKGNERVAVESSNGPTVYCNYLVVTVPQSILSLSPLHTHGITWIPPLPSNITDALENIHFGALGKVIFEFESCWWDINEDRFEILADSTDDSLLSSPISLSPESFKFPVFAVNCAAVYKESVRGASLCILTQSPLTDYLESHPQQAWSYFKPMLSKLETGNDLQVSDPINTITSESDQ